MSGWPWISRLIRGLFLDLALENDSSLCLCMHVCVCTKPSWSSSIPPSSSSSSPSSLSSSTLKLFATVRSNSSCWFSSHSFCRSLIQAADRCLEQPPLCLLGWTGLVPVRNSLGVAVVTEAAHGRLCWFVSAECGSLTPNCVSVSVRNWCVRTGRTKTSQIRNTVENNNSDHNPERNSTLKTKDVNK